MFKLGLAQCCHPADGDVLGMADTWMARAKAQGVDVLVFPESLMTPFELANDDFAAQAEPLDGPFCAGMDALAAKHGLWVIYTANERSDGDELAAPRPESLARRPELPTRHPERSEGSPPFQVGTGLLKKAARPFNTAVVVDAAAQKQAAYRKVHLFDTDFVKESDKVAPGGELMCSVETPFGRLALGICYDLRFPELARAAALAGADMLVYPSAWVDGARKVFHWKTLLAARAIENEVFVAGVSRCDRGFGAAHRDYAGHSCVFNPFGDAVAEASGIVEELVIADIDLAAIAEARAAMPVLQHRRPDAYAPSGIGAALLGHVDPA